MYHRVTPHIAGVAQPTWNVTPDRFRRQLQGLLSRGYKPWPLRRVLECRKTGEPLPAGVFVVTFDDGYDCIYHEAWPILKELSVPATVFVVTSCLDSDSPFVSDNWTAAGSASVPTTAWQPLSTSHCAEMIDQGLVEIGSHTHSHVDLHGQPEAFRRDLLQSLEVLRESLGVEHATFAFPFGSYDSELVAVARESGLLCALTAEQRRVSLQADPFTWGRFTVLQSDNTATLLLKLSGWYTTLRSAWKWCRRPWHTNRAMSEQYDASRQSSGEPLSTPTRMVSL
jgi:peptidoglycan/xylan/chitin deacetylase (PgdA/CDA1 family)